MVVVVSPFVFKAAKVDAKEEDTVKDIFIEAQRPHENDPKKEFRDHWHLFDLIAIILPIEDDRKAQLLPQTLTGIPSVGSEIEGKRPTFEIVPRLKRPPRCSICRQPGHDKRTCTENKKK